MESKLEDEEIERNERNMELLHEVDKCKAAIYKLWKREMKMEASHQECDVKQNATSRNED